MRNRYKTWGLPSIGLSVLFLAAGASAQEAGAPGTSAPDTDKSRLHPTLPQTGARPLAEPQPDEAEAELSLDKESWYEPLNQAKDRLIHELIKQGRVEDLNTILAQGYDPDVVNDYGQTAMYTLADQWFQFDDNTRTGILNSLQKYNADIYRADNSGIRPLTLSLSRNYKKLRDRLIRYGDDVTIPSLDKNGNEVYPIVPVANSGDFESFKYVVENGGDITWENHEGKNAVDAVFANLAFVEGLAKLKYIHEKTGYDIVRRATENPEPLTEALVFAPDHSQRVAENNSHMMGRLQNFLNGIKYLNNAGLDLNDIVHRKTGENLAMKIAAYNDVDALQYFEDSGFKLFNRPNEQGATALDFAIIYGTKKAEEWLKKRGVTSAFEDMRNADLPKDLDRLVQKYNAGKISAVKSLTSEEINDFYYMYPVLEQPAYNNGKNPLVMLTGIMGVNKASIDHLDDTTIVAQGVSKKLTGDAVEEPPILGFVSNPVIPESLYQHAGEYNNATLLFSGLLENKGAGSGDVILSHSVAFYFRFYTDETLKELYQEYNSPDPEEYKAYFYDLNPIVHLSNGNNYANSCITLESRESKEFCLRDLRAFKFSGRSVNVGAANLKNDGTWLVHDYSDSQPTYCAPLPLKKEKKLFLGTSFAAPASASVERTLMEFHGRSDKLPEGVTHEDIMLALQLTARRDMIDERTGKPVPFNENSAGVGMSWRCGAGIIRPDHADKLLKQMVEMAQAGKAKPTIPKSYDVRIDTDSASSDMSADNEITDGREYHYTIDVPASGAVTKPFLYLNFEFKNRGAARLISPRGTVSYLRPGLTGDVDTDEFWGEHWYAGETLTLITTKPLLPGGTDAVIRMAELGSVFSQTALRQESMLINVDDEYLFSRLGEKEEKQNIVASNARPGQKQPAP